MRQFIERHSFWSFVILIALGVFLWLVFAVWPEWLEDAIGRKKTFVNTFLNGLTLAGLSFLVASGFTLVFGLIRTVTLAHGPMYLRAAHVAYASADATGHSSVAPPSAFPPSAAPRTPPHASSS